MSKFKVGDKVKVFTLYRYSGKAGMVLDVARYQGSEDALYLVVIDDPEDGFNAEAAAFDEWELEIAS